ncbi:MAG: SGNH/GDSL hydrolase family protein [Planctomycetaceae bacterium]|nr:SGNH/GDSL hydrolase family protein [Planctomycetaceae bacterium]
MKTDHLTQTPDRKPRFRRLFWGIVILILLACSAKIGVFLIGQYRPIGTGPAGPFVSREPFQSVWSERQVLLLGIGDSVTAGFGVDAPYNYVSRLLVNPPGEFPDMQGLCLRAVLPNITVLNISVSGSTSLHHAEHIEDDARFPVQAKDVFGIIVMTSGGNDLIHNYGQTPPREGAMYGATLEQAKPWIDNFRERLDRMMTGISDKFPGGCLIFLADVYDPTDGIGDAPSVFLPAWPDCMKILDAYNAVLRECTTRHDNVIAVPMHEAFLGHGIHCAQWWRATYRPEDPTYWFHSNIEDPNIRGYDAIRRLFLNAVVEERERIAAQDEQQYIQELYHAN